MSADLKFFEALRWCGNILRRSNITTNERNTRQWLLLQNDYINCVELRSEQRDFVCLLFESHQSRPWVDLNVVFFTPHEKREKKYFHCGECVTTSKVDFEGLKKPRMEEERKKNWKATTRKTFLFLYSSSHPECLLIKFPFRIIHSPLAKYFHM